MSETDVTRPSESNPEQDELGDLFKRALSGDRRAEDQLWEIAVKVAYKLAFRYFSGSNEDVDDVIQNVFLKLRSRFPDIAEMDEINSFFSYLAMVVNNCCRDEIKRRRRKINQTTSLHELGDDDGDEDGLLAVLASADDVFENVSQREQLEKISRCVSGLSKEKADVFRLYCSGLKYTEIAETLDINENTVATLIRRTKIDIRLQLCDDE